MSSEAWCLLQNVYISMKRSALKRKSSFCNSKHFYVRRICLHVLTVVSDISKCGIWRILFLYFCTFLHADFSVYGVSIKIIYKQNFVVCSLHVLLTRGEFLLLVTGWQLMLCSVSLYIRVQQGLAAYHWPTFYTQHDITEWSKKYPFRNLLWWLTKKKNPFQDNIGA